MKNQVPEALKDAPKMTRFDLEWTDLHQVAGKWMK